MSSKKSKTEPTDLSLIKQVEYKKRDNKSYVSDFGRPMKNIDGADFFESLPNFLKAADLEAYINSVKNARDNNKPFQMLLGAHTIKVGLSPIIIDLIRKDIVTGVSFNCAGVIHDLELAFFGGTSEDVQKGLMDGSFGMVKETSELFARVTELSFQKKIGLGEAAGRFISEENPPHKSLSVFGVAYEEKADITVHIGVGTDIVAQHPNYDAAKTAAASHLDFRKLCAICSEIDDGGVVANIGSAVILPEVFLKALTVARNIKGGAGKLTTANFDMIMHYRPTENVVNRPTYKVGKGYNFVGHHELMVPLLAWGLRRKLNK